MPVVVAALIYLVAGYSAGTQIGRSGDPAAFIHPGDLFLAPELLPPDAFVYQDSTGYDGQFFFYLAQDPLLTGKAAEADQLSSPHLDLLGYRYQRILLPALGWLTSWGEPRILEWTLPLINVLAVLGSGFLLARFLAARDRPPWLALVYMTSVGVLAAVVNDLSDPLAVGMFMAGVVWWLEERTWPAVIALAACLLAREVYLIPVLVIAVLELVRSRRQGLVWLLPVAILGIWQLTIRLWLAYPITPDTVERPSIVPLLGAARKVREVVRVDWLGSANWEVLFVGLLLAIVGIFRLRTAELADRVRRSRRLPPREQLVPLVALASVVLVPFLTVALWRYIPSYARYTAPAAGLLVVMYGIARDRLVAISMFALMALTLTNPVVALLPISHPPAVQDPATPP